MIDDRLVAFVRDPAFWRAAVPCLSIVGTEAAVVPCTPECGALERAREQLLTDGYFRLPGLASCDELVRLRAGIARIVEQGWPPLFVFFFDEPWQLLSSMRPLLESLLGKEYRPLAGFWAWSLATSSRARGWPPHRDRAVPSTRADGTPEIMTLWIAITDATPENGCIYVVPAALDPGYCGDLDSVEVAHPADVRALAASAGTVFGWTQQLLHWGGRSSAWAKEPRVSLSMEFQRGDVALLGEPIDDVPSFDERVRLIGMQIRHYAHIAPPAEGLNALAAAIEG